MKLSDLIKGIEICEYTSDMMNMDVSGISSDSRSIKKGDIFVCVCGTKSDGHEYVSQAAEAGAAAVIAERWTPDIQLLAVSGIPVMRVKNVRLALAYLWSNYYGCPGKSLEIIAVTGTNGKTSVTNMLKSIFEEAGIPCALIGTITHSLTTPDPEQLYKELRELADNGIKYVFMEASSHALKLDKLGALRFRCGIFTNLTREHLDFHHTMEDYLNSKAKLFKLSDAAVINIDDEYGKALVKMSGSKKVYTYSAESDSADFSAKQAELNGIDGITYNFLTTGHLFRIHSPIPGGFTVYNTLAASSAAYLCGVPPRAIRDGIASLHGVRGRIERIQLPQTHFACYIDYAHTPDALENVLRSLRGFMTAGQRLVVLFGCGGDRDPGKRPVMGEIASTLADYLIITSDNSRSEDKAEIIRQILTGIRNGCGYTVIEDRREAIRYAVRTAVKGDVILLAGKGHEDYEIDRSGRHPFSERELLQEAALEIYRRDNSEKEKMNDR